MTRCSKLMCDEKAYHAVGFEDGLRAYCPKHFLWARQMAKEERAILPVGPSTEPDRVSQAVDIARG